MRVTLDFEEPVFKSEVLSLDDLNVGLVLTGCVRNVTSFGAFVDIGVKEDGLLHNNNNNLNVELGPGDKVEVKVKNLDKQRNRIGLCLIKKITKELHLL